MATLAQLRTRVSRKIKDPDNTGLSASDVDFEINRAIRYYSRFRFWFNEELDTITLTANTQEVPSVPSNLISHLQVNGLTVIDGNYKQDLISLLPDQFVTRDHDQKGRPYYYTYRDGSYLLLPTPDSAYSLLFRYLKSYNDLSSDSDTNDFTDNAEDLIMMAAIRAIYAEDKEEPSLASYYETLEREEYRALREQTDNRLNAGMLTVDSILNNN